VSAVRAWFVHLYTASGVVFALLATLETDGRRIFVWLTIAVLIDATDGPMARRFEVKRVLPHIHGRTIDDIVDYLTFTFIPLLVMVKFRWLPDPAIAFVAPAMMASLLGFANSGAKNEERGFFLGFPSYWNIVVFYLGIAAAHGLLWLNAMVVLALAALTIAPVGFIYPNLAPARWKVWILGGALLWLVMILAMLVRYPNPAMWLVWVSLIYPAFYTIVSFREYRRR
jgi:phosphatidylcholine synthase